MSGAVAVSHGGGIDAIAKALGARAKRDEPLSRHTSFHVGGPADLLVQPRVEEDLALALRLVREHGLPLLVLGGGSNLVVRDGGVRGVVVKMMKNFGGSFPEEGHRLRARAGEPAAKVATRAAELGLSGVEFAVGIPGTVGGGVVTNAGAHGGDWGRRVEWVAGVAEDGRSTRIPRGDLSFGYRKAVLPPGFVITEAQLVLEPDDPKRVMAVTRGYQDDRRAKQPVNIPSAGCFFKNPAGGFAGKLIEEAGLKGFRIGNMEVSPKHANFIVNLGGGTAREALAMIDAIQERVLSRHGVRVETEVMIVGEDAS